MFYTNKTNTDSVNTKKIIYLSKGKYEGSYNKKEFYLFIYTNYKEYFLWKYPDEKERDEEFDKLLEILNRKSDNEKALNEIKL